MLHDVISIRHAKKALEAGVDGLILVASGAGGHAGTLSPFALVGEVRKFFDGPLALSGSIATGDAVLAAQAMGADFAYIGSRWLATKESNVSDGYRDAIVDSSAADIVQARTCFTGVHGNYLKNRSRRGRTRSGSLARSGQEFDEFCSAAPRPGATSGARAKAWA